LLLFYATVDPGMCVGITSPIDLLTSTAATSHHPTESVTWS